MNSCSFFLEEMQGRPVEASRKAPERRRCERACRDGPQREGRQSSPREGSARRHQRQGQHGGDGPTGAAHQHRPGVRRDGPEEEAAEECW